MIRVYKLPFRAGVGVGIAAAVVVGAASTFVAAIPVWIVALISLLVGAAGYFVVCTLVIRRIDELEQSLKTMAPGSFGEDRVFERRSGDELARLGLIANGTSVSVAREMDRLKKIETYRRDFIGNVSHELKTPIFAIKGFSETLLRGALDDPAVKRSFVERILRNADRLENLARDLSAISRIETGELTMDSAAFRLHEVIADVIESLEPRASEKNLVIRPLLPKELPDALGDKERIREVLTNLVDNAIKYSNDGGTVEVVARFVEPASIKVSVVDDGIGVGEEHFDRLTERFYRVDKSRSRSQGGTGLGLSIVKHILGAHGKRLQIQSVEGKGSTFGFSIDAATGDTALPPAESTLSHLDTPDSGTQGG
ncbi:MAG: histidine kinase [Rhodothermales bacterium]|nr:histidine kinase [Rhodothermales bacterium]